MDVFSDQPYTYSLVLLLGHYLISVLLFAVLLGYATFLHEVVFVYLILY